MITPCLPCDIIACAQTVSNIITYDLGMKIDDDKEESLGGRGSRDRDGDLGSTSEADWLSVAPYHLARKSCQISSAGSHTALDLAVHSQLPGSTKMGSRSRRAMIAPV